MAKFERRVTRLEHAERGMGRTTSQMRGAPEAAVYVWCNDALAYPRRLAQSLGRGDLDIVPPAFVTDARYMGLGNAVILDHAVELSAEGFARLVVHNVLIA